MTGSTHTADQGPHTPLVSVVIPTFNRADVLRRAVNSVLDQVGIHAFEIIIVDDCSTDGTGAVVAELAENDSRIRYLRHDENQGGAVARNSGISAAKGYYLAFLDSDDTWMPTKLAAQVTLVERSEAAGKAVCHTQVRAIGPHGEELLPRRRKHSDESVAEYLFVSGGHIQTSSIFLSTALAANTRFDPQLRKHQDYDFCLRLEDNGAEFILLNEPLVSWYHDPRPDRITTTYGLPDTEHFLRSRANRLGDTACAAFWTIQVFPKMFSSHPLIATGRLLRQILLGPLPLHWYGRWLSRAMRRRLPRRKSASAHPSMQ